MLQHAARTLSLEKILYEEGLSFGIVRHYRQIQAGFIRSVDALIIQPASIREFEHIIRELRAMPEPQDYLKPLFSVDTPKMRACLHHELDGFTKLDNLSDAVERVEAIQQRIDKIGTPSEMDLGFDAEILMKILQFLYSRQTTLQPHPSRFSKVHYHFPFATFFLEEAEEQRLLTIFKMGVKRGYLNGELVDKIHQCPDCGSAHHNLRATCAKCRHVDIAAEDLIHHFPCATISPISDFQKDGHNGLLCPKCNKSLRHIGNDYDKPSSIYNCKQCQHTFQQADYRSLCIDCGQDLELHRLAESDICRYRLTSKGTGAVVSGTMGTVAEDRPKNISAKDGIYSFDVFKTLVKRELSKSGRDMGLGMLGQVKFDGLNVEQMAEAHQAALSLEVCQIIKSYLRETGIVSAKGPKAYYFMVPDSNQPEAEQLKTVLAYNLRQILISNIRHKSLQVKVVVERLAGQQ